MTLFDKLWDMHNVTDLGGGALLYIDRIFLHERTGGIALVSLEEAGRTVRHPEKVFCTMDHIVDTLPGRDDRSLMKGGIDFIQTTRRVAKAANITLFDLQDEAQGIVHVISPEQGIVLPGLTLVCPDSHTCTQGAFGALAWGIGSTEAEHAMVTGTLRVERPKNMRVNFHGKLASDVTAKDMILHLIATYGTSGGRGYAVEFAGEAVEALDMEGRMTLCNMAVEFGAFTGLIAPDDKTFAYLKGRPYAPKGAEWDDAVTFWQGLRSSPQAAFAQEIEIDAAKISPCVSWGTNPGQAVPVDSVVPSPEGISDKNALKYMALSPGQKMSDLKIDGAFIGSCTNSRLSDLRRAADILKGNKVAPGVRAICVPGSMAVKRAAEKEGLDQIFIDAGFEWRCSGCSMCFFAGGESFGFQERVVTCTNRNFESRQGPKTRSHLASPETVAASAIAGHICDVRSL